MNNVLLSDLAVAQLKEVPPESGRQLLDALQRLRLFPESAPRLSWEGYEAYRQVVIRPYRAIFRYRAEEGEVRVYCILHTRRSLPPTEFLQHQTF